jgi:hypothetical protein
MILAWDRALNNLNIRIFLSNKSNFPLAASDTTGSHAQIECDIQRKIHGRRYNSATDGTYNRMVEINREDSGLNQVLADTVSARVGASIPGKQESPNFHPFRTMIRCPH